MSIKSKSLLSSLLIQQIKQLLKSYGLGLLFTANVVGAESIYILGNTGTKFGYWLLWTMPLSLLLGMGMHEMSGRLAIINQPLMEYIRDTVGELPAKLLAYVIAFIMYFWAILNFAMCGAALVWLTLLENLHVGVVLVAGIGVAIVDVQMLAKRITIKHTVNRTGST
ncbi:divalent metal cation transporter [Haladaptatus halobius]|uniref:divalent metal cation transporter n=1 Tax=Haladaptatus halobius TaxID=2884875 RepID=UPI001D0A500F|nr:divalent metal cation transporter [Haladaptatus halobius]